MLSMDCSTPSFNTPILRDPSTPHLQEDPFTPLEFDDLLDIAREFEFARTITHIWPSDEESSACTEAVLDGILAAIVPTPTCEERPIPSPAESMVVQPVQVQEINSQRSTSACPAPHTNAYLDQVDNQIRTETVDPTMSTLQGWTPPNGQFLDLDDSLILPQPVKEVWSSPWLATFPASSLQPLGESHSAIGDAHPATAPQLPPMATTNKIAEDPGEKSVPTAALPSARAVLEPLHAQFAEQSNSSLPRRMVITPKAKIPQSRPHMSSTPAKGTSNYARPPRGGVPPHIARSVTKANILRVEKERKVMQDAFSSTTMGEAKKPSVLRRTAKVEKLTGKNTNGGGKKMSDRDENNEKEGRAAKRAKV